MDKNNLNDYKEKISLNIKGKLDKIFAIEYKYELNEIISSIKEMSLTDRKEILGELINYNLYKILEVNDFEKIKRSNESIDEAMEFFDQKDDYESCEEADEITDDLVCKVLGQKDRHVKLPIPINFIEDFCIHSNIESDKLEKILILMVIKLSVINYCVDNNIK